MAEDEPAGVASQSKIDNLDNFGKKLLDNFSSLVVTRKLDGTNARIAYQNQEDQIYLGSKNMLWEIEEDTNNQGFGGEWVRDNLPVENLKDCSETVTLLGEFCGPDILKRIDYPDYFFRVFDVAINGLYMDWPAVLEICDELGFKTVPYEVEDSVDVCLGYVDAKDPYAEGDKDLSEGVVIRPCRDFWYHTDRVIFKAKSDKFKEIVKERQKSRSKNKGPDFDSEEIERLEKYITESRVFSCINQLAEGEDKFEPSKEDTGDLIKTMFDDIQAEADEEFSEKLMRKVAGNKIAGLFHEMLKENKL